MAFDIGDFTGPFVPASDMKPLRSYAKIRGEVRRSITARLCKRDPNRWGYKPAQREANEMHAYAEALGIGIAEAEDRVADQRLTMALFLAFAPDGYAMAAE